MIDPLNVPVVSDDELLARFILQSNEYRASDGSVTHRLFMPYKLIDLSVNRHRDATVDETWFVGHAVARKRQKTLLGRSDILARHCRIGDLKVICDPILADGPDDVDNPNHANISGYPPQKEDQKAIAMKLAERAKPRITPP